MGRNPDSNRPLYDSKSPTKVKFTDGTPATIALFVTTSSAGIFPMQQFTAGRTLYDTVEGNFNQDGITDLAAHFRTQETGIDCEDDSMSLSWETFEGGSSGGADAIQMSGCRSGRGPASLLGTDRRTDEAEGVRLREIRRQ